jgi:hypothetical protein
MFSMMLRMLSDGSTSGLSWSAKPSQRYSVHKNLSGNDWTPFPATNGMASVHVLT